MPALPAVGQDHDAGAIERQRGEHHEQEDDRRRSRPCRSPGRASGSLKMCAERFIASTGPRSSMAIAGMTSRLITLQAPPIRAARSRRARSALSSARSTIDSSAVISAQPADRPRSAAARHAQALAEAGGLTAQRGVRRRREADTDEGRHEADRGRSASAPSRTPGTRVAAVHQVRGRERGRRHDRRAPAGRRGPGRPPATCARAASASSARARARPPRKRLMTSCFGRAARVSLQEPVERGQKAVVLRRACRR